MSPVRMSRLESAARVVLEFKDAFNRHDVAEMVRRLSDDCVVEAAEPAPDGTRFSGKAAVARHWEEFFRTWSQVQMQPEDIAGMGLQCVLRYRYEWEDSQGRKQHLRGVGVFQVRDGTICEMLTYVKGPMTAG